MFETGKLPTEQRTVTGNSVSFNTHYALPLDACKITFEATQSGTGDPSPYNPRAISGVSVIGLNANSTPVSVSLGKERFGGELDVLTGGLTSTHNLLDLGNLVYVKGNRNNDDTGFVFYAYYTNAKAGTAFKCEEFKFVSNVSSWESMHLNEITHTGSYVVIVADYQLAADFKTAITGVNLLYQLAEPLTVQLSANELSTIAGNNTFSTDTGSLEISFQDLQEKSASGAVATFNTALVMPLPSFNIAVNAWQEGSGDPSPVNKRPIHGWTASNVTRAGKNLFDINNPFITAASQTYLNDYPPRIDNGKIYNGGRIGATAGGGITIPAIPNINYTFSYYINGENCNGEIRAVTIDNNGIWTSSRTLSPSAGGNAGAYKSVTVTMLEGYTHLFIALYSANRYTSWETDLQIEAGSTATAYEPYVTPTIYTIQLGQEVYGAEVDVVNGVAHITWKKTIVDENSSLEMVSKYIKSDACDVYYVDTDIDVPRMITLYNNTTCNYLKRTARGTSIWKDVGYPNCYTINARQLHLNIANDVLGITDYTQETTTTAKEKIKNYLSNNNLEFLVPVIPFDIQLTPTQIGTLIGNNTIFADTGDIDLTYKDCDLAKRGDFRQVFKIPD